MAFDDDHYVHVAKNDTGIRKKKQKKKDKKIILEQVTRTVETMEVQKKQGPTRTKAEIAFQKMREKMETKRILEKALTTHRDHHLNRLLVHFDVSKVSWTIIIFLFFIMLFINITLLSV